MKLNLIVKTYRAEIAKFINAQQNEIAFTSGATESMNLIVNNLQEKLVKGDEVIISYGEHTTNLIP
jgi:cysteine desulfurase/selenocysteine lyase